MPNVLVDCASAVVDALNDAPDGTFSQEFEAERSYADWDLPLEENQGGKLKVDCVPVPQLQNELESEGALKYGPAVDIAIRLGLRPERRTATGKFKLEEIDALVQFVQEIAEFFAVDRFGDIEQFAWNPNPGTQILAAHSPKHLRDHHQFTGIVRVPFRTTIVLG